MNTPSSLQAVKRLFSFPFSDPDWKNKFLIGSGLAFGSFVIPILPIIPLMGYGARIARQSAEGETGEPYKLPEWDDWNGLFADGLRQFGASFVITLPVTLIFVVIFGLYFAGMMGFTFAENDPRRMQEAAPLFMVGMASFWCGMPLMFLFSAVCYFFIPVTQVHVAVKREFSALFRWREWWPILRANAGGFLVVLFLLMGAYTVFIFVFQILYFTVILCFIAPLLFVPAWFYGLLLLYHLSALAYADGQGNVALGGIQETFDPEPVP